MRATCTATRKDGTPCTAGAQQGRPYCWGHDPDLAEQRRAKSAQGGTNKATIRRLERRMPGDLRPVLDHLYGALEGLQTGETDPKTATAMASVASAIGRLYEVSVVQVQLDALAGVLEPERKRQIGR